MADPITVTISDDLRLAGIAAARVAYVAALPAEIDDPDHPGQRISNPLLTTTDAQYIQRVIEGACDSYVAAHEVGWIPSAEFVLRFTPQEIGAIKAAAAVSAPVADYLAQVNAAPKVRVVSTLVRGGVDALIAAGLVAADRRAALLAY